MALSIRHRLLQVGLRRVFRPISHYETPMSWQRALVDSISAVVRTPAGLRVANATLAGRPAQRITPLGVAPGRHLLYLHGGAYVAGSLRSHGPIAGLVADAIGAEAWLLDYRLAPEHVYPAAREDALSAYRELLDRGIGAGEIILAGDSAGGGLTLSTALAIRDAGWPLPAALVLLSPWTDLTLGSPSHVHNARVEAMLSPRFMARSAAHYCAEGGSQRPTPRADPGVSPLFADLAGLPPMIAHVGGDEVLLDDARLVVERAQAAGGEATLRVFDGLFHVFPACAGILPEADESLREIGDFCRAQLARRA